MPTYIVEFGKKTAKLFFGYETRRFSDTAKEEGGGPYISSPDGSSNNSAAAAVK